MNINIRDLRREMFRLRCAYVSAVPADSSATRDARRPMSGQLFRTSHRKAARSLDVALVASQRCCSVEARIRRIYIIIVASWIWSRSREVATPDRSVPMRTRHLDRFGPAASLPAEQRDAPGFYFRCYSYEIANSHLTTRRTAHGLHIRWQRRSFHCGSRAP